MSTSATTRHVAQSGVAVAVVTGAAVAILQVLQQAIGAFNPRPAIYGLVIAAVFLAGLARERQRVRRRQNDTAARLHRLLVIWPPRPLRDLDRLWLGTFPARRDVDPAAPYVERDGDEQLRAALRAGAVVLVCGPPRAGKSRTAVEATASALSEAQVIAPRGPDALSELLSFEPPLDLGAGERIVWLDDLERYAEILDACTLDELQALGAPRRAEADLRPVPRHAPPPPATVIATVRAGDWDALLTAGGVRGETARAFAARARVFDVPAALTPGELAEARRLYPGVDFDADDGIGAALASSGREVAPAAALTRPSEDRERQAPLLRDPFLVVPAAGTLAAVLCIGLVWWLSGFSTPAPPSIADQITAIEATGAHGGRHARLPVPGAIDLHGSGEASYLFLFQDAAGARRPRSEEIRIYDRQGDRLVQRLRFEPDRPGAVFQFRSATDVDFDGASEIVGGYGLPGEGRGALVPFAIDWDNATRRYDLVSLDMGPPRLSQDPLPRAYRVPERQYRTLYAKALVLRDARSRQRISGHRVQDFTVTGAPQRLVAGYFLRPPLAQRDHARLELQGAILSAATGAPHLTPCAFADRPPVALDLSWGERSLPKAIEESWAQASAASRCAPS